MPLPLALPVVGIVALAGAAVAAVGSRLSPKRVVILGTPKSGKSALLEAFGPDEDGIVRLEIAGKSRRLAIKPGPDSRMGAGWRAWRDAFTQNDYVWYVFRADLVQQGDPTEIKRISEHFASFSLWMKDDPKPPRVTLIGTHADRAPSYAVDPADFHSAVAADERIRFGVVRLNHAAIIVGSLSEAQSARTLLASVAESLA